MIVMQDKKKRRRKKKATMNKSDTTRACCCRSDNSHDFLFGETKRQLVFLFSGGIVQMFVLDQTESQMIQVLLQVSKFWASSENLCNHFLEKEDNNNTCLVKNSLILC